MKEQTKKLATMLGMGGLNGTVTLAAISGMFKLENVFLIALLLIAGPGSILIACMSEGVLKERIFSALIAGFIATVIVMLAAGIGPKLLDFVNLNMVKLAGGISIILIGLTILGLQIPSKFPFLVIITGIIGGILLK
jgi:hypothetical protein